MKMMKALKKPLPPLGTVETDTRYLNGVYRVTVKEVRTNQVTGNRWWYVTQRKTFMMPEAAQSFVDDVVCY
jgi:hypothetical protein